MKNISPSALWDDIIDRYCTSEEKQILADLPDQEYENDLEFAFGDLLDVIQNKLNKVASSTDTDADTDTQARNERNDN